MIDMNDKVIATVEDKYYSIYTFVKENDDIDQLIYKAEHQYSNFPEWNRKYTCMTFREYLEKEKQHYK